MQAVRLNGGTRSAEISYGEHSAFACPECHGVLSRIPEGIRVRYRCHTGHAYSTAALLAEYAEATEASLWNAIRTMEETEALLRTRATELQTLGEAQPAEAARADATSEQAQSKIIREVLSQRSDRALKIKPSDNP